MTEQTDNSTGSSAWLGTAWLVAAIVLVVGGLGAYYALGAQPMPVRAGALVAGLVLGVGAFALSTVGRTAWEFALGSRVELRKMVWPTGRDTRVTTVIVIVFVAVLSVFFWVVDWLLAHGTRALLGTGS